MIKSPCYSILNPYELYYGGWIDFWDTEVRQDSTDHAVYLQLREHVNYEQDKDEYNETSHHKARYTLVPYILQTKLHVNWNVYVNVASPPTSTDPPPVKSGNPPL
jgi:hypothetical protein